MELELALHPDDAAKLLHLKLLAPSRTGRARTLAVRIIWHDSMDRALATQGLSLAEHRGHWRLERLLPGPAQIWPPGAPAPCLREADEPIALTHLLPDPLAPVAAFEGRQTTLSLQSETDPVSLLLQRGVLRAVTSEHACCRVLVSGPDEAVRTLAQALAEELRASVPRLALAAEALAIAGGEAPQPRRLGAPDLPEEVRESVPAAFRHVLGHLTDVIQYHAQRTLTGETDTEAVHQMRVAMRRARSAISVFRGALACPALTAANDRLRILGSRLGSTRDWDVFVTETAASLSLAVPQDTPLARMIAAAQRRRHGAHAALHDWLSGPEFRLLCIELSWMAGSQSWIDAVGAAEQDALTMKLPAFAALVQQQRWKKLLAAGRQIETLDVLALHNLRLRAKRARYAAEIFAALYPGKAPDRFIKRLGRLQQHLGVMNDQAVAAKLLEELGGKGGRHAYANGLLLGFLAASAATVRPAILRAWAKIQHLSPFWA